MLKHLTSAKQIDKKIISHLFSLADRIKFKKYNPKILDGKIMATLFYEPSTRTRLSFESAMQRLGGSVISTENAAEFSSAAKGESLEDTIRIVNGYADVIVLRHFNEGASQIASNYSNVPIINAGDGKGEHPSQALLDLYTIKSKFKTLNITISMVGDLLNGRTIHSLSYLLALYKEPRLVFVSPKQLSIPKELKRHLEKEKINFIETEDLDNALKNSDVIYQTRVQKERFKKPSDYNRFKNLLIIDKKSLRLMKASAIIMHPLPRVGEISKEVDQDPRAFYFEQAKNGLYVRMALLLHLFDKAR